MYEKHLDIPTSSCQGQSKHQLVNISNDLFM